MFIPWWAVALVGGYLAGVVSAFYFGHVQYKRQQARNAERLKLFKEAGLTAEVDGEQDG